jgi:hypothetical protein
MRWFYALLDSPFLARVGNLQTAFRVAVWVALCIAALSAGIIQAVSDIATIWLILIALGVFGLLLECLVILARRRRDSRAQQATGTATTATAQNAPSPTPLPGTASRPEHLVEPAAAQSARPAFITGIRGEGVRIAGNVTSGDVDFIRDSDLKDADIDRKRPAWGRAKAPPDTD